MCLSSTFYNVEEFVVRKNIPPLDLLFYLMETHDNPKHVAGLQIFQMPTGAPEDYLLKLVDKLRQTRPVEPFNNKPVFPRVGRPYWETDEHVEMEYHLRHSALPKPGTMQQLMAVVQRLHAGVIDRERPGWICQVIEGLEGNRFAVYCKIHHAYIDGMSAVARIYGALSRDLDSEEVEAVWTHQPAADKRGRDSSSGGAVSTLRKMGRTAATQARGVAQLNRQVAQVVMELLRLRDHTGHIPFKAPRTRINDPLHSDLRSMGVTSMPLDRLKGIAKAADCTLNDVVLAITDAALHDYLAKHRDEPDRPLVAMCPMSVRDPSDTDANTQVATLLVELGQPGASARERLEQVAKSASRSKADARELSREGLMDFVLLVGGVFEMMQRTGLDRVVPQSYNVLVSNVPGPKDADMYMMGSRMEAIYPISTLTPGNNLNVTVLSHGNSLDWGLLAARGTLPDIEYLVERLDRQFELMAAEYGVGGKRKAAAAGKRGAKAPRKAKARPKSRPAAKRKGKAGAGAAAGKSVKTARSASRSR
jgi:diacylglycerol O-acyltransferase